MAIKTDEQRKQRMMDGKPIGEFFNAAAQRQKRDNQFATYDRPGSAGMKAAVASVAKKPDLAPQTETKAAAPNPAPGKITLAATMDSARLSARKVRRAGRVTSKMASAAPSTPRAIDSYTSKPSPLAIPRSPEDAKRQHSERIAEVDRDAQAKRAEEDKQKDRLRRSTTVPYNPYKPRASFS